MKNIIFADSNKNLFKNGKKYLCNSGNDNSYSPVIGLLMNNFHNMYTLKIWCGIKKALEKYSANLICFAGGSFNNPHYDNSQKNEIFKLVKSRRIDGILSLSSLLGSYICKNSMGKFLTSFGSIPHVSVGISFNNISNIVINNRTGMYELMRHLLNDHGYKNVVFVKGPEKNVEVKARFNVYKDVLRENNIAFNPELVVSGTFNNYYGRKAVSWLLDERKVKFDVIIASNDYVAINIINELKRRRIRVPEDVAVVGFDNILQSSHFEIPITTVNQPVFKLGYQAVKLLISKLRGNETVLKKELKSHLIIRKSCGCTDVKKIGNSNKSNQQISINITSVNNNSINVLSDMLAEKMFNEFNKIVGKSKLTKWAEILILSLIQELKGITKGKFKSSLIKIIDRSFRFNVYYNLWNTIILYLFNNIMPLLKLDSCENMKIKLLNDTLYTIHEIIIKNLGYYIIKNNEDSMFITMLKKKLHDVSDLDSLKKIINDYFPCIGIRSCFISVFINMIQAKLLVGYNHYKFIDIDYDLKEKIYNTSNLFPFKLDKNSKNPYFIYSIISRKKLLGYVVFELDNTHINLSNILRNNMNNFFEYLLIELGNCIKHIPLDEKIKIQIKTDKEKTKKIINSNTFNKYHKFSLPKYLADKYYNKLLDVMEKERLYTDTELTLNQLANKLNITRNHLSYVINSYFKVNFYEFLSAYRIERAKEYLLNNDKNINILDVVYDSGFKSKSTFYRIFKENTDLTPLQFKKKFLKKKRFNSIL